VSHSASNTVLRIANKEITLFFASPIAYLFLASFVAVTLFVFFWGEAFFARNIADVRPLFEWMPVLLIFLSATLTMRLWSEERRSGTLESLLTQPVPLWQFVLGKFLGCLFLLAVALLITLPLPITVSIIGDLDWGPVFAGYLATLLMGSAYLSMGLFVSARSENQIVSLISATALCGAFYLIGNSAITEFFSNDAGQWLRLIGIGSRFEAITRGVIDVRDLVYYLSLVLIFLSLNAYVLERERWVSRGGRPQHRRWQAVVGLLVLNALVANLWFGQIHRLRWDMTQGQIYSISDATRRYLNQLQEPLLIRGYFSSKTHPLLAPLVPQIRDLIEEYQVAGGDKVRVEFIDPLQDPEAEKTANQKYGIEPVPFQVADRYQSSIVSSYFNVLVQYGEQFEVLDFQDLIEVQARGEDNIDVQLRNPEHDLTRAVKQVLAGYQSGGNVFNAVNSPVTFTAYISADADLPEKLVTFKQQIQTALQAQKEKANGKLNIEFIDPRAGNGELVSKLKEDYGFLPMTTGLLASDSFYFYLTLSQGEQMVQVPLDDFTENSFERNFESAVKRFANGFTKTVALVTPNRAPAASPFMPPAGSKFTQLENYLNTELNVVKEDLSDGSVSSEADILLLVSPEDLDEKSLFAVDQFLMQGGTIILATSPFVADFANRSLALNNQTSGLEAWLKSQGITLAKSLVLDPQNSAFPVPVTRNVGGFQMQEIRMLDYPYFIDVRDDGLNQNSLITSGLPQLTVPWASPITATESAERKITPLVTSSAGAWTSASTDVMPKLSAQGVSAYLPEGKTGTQLLAVLSEGRFNSSFAGKPSPLLADDKPADDQQKPAAEELHLGSVIERSPASARLMVFAANDLWRDEVLQMASGINQTQYLNSLQLAANAIDWALEDSALLSIRSRGHFNRTLPPLDGSQQTFWEYGNYALALIALLIVAVWERLLRRRKLSRYQHWLGA